MSNILEQANKIINERSEEKERQYGPMGEGFERAAMIASGMSGREWNAHDMFIAMVALKFSRQSYNFKEDNLLDAVAYIGAWQNYINENKPDFAGPDFKEEVSSTKPDPYQIEEEDTQDGPIVESPYASDHPRSVLSAIIKLGETK
tara:strand:- start:19813 stop:20250 length:438 start_codon:yes stop_codon:yes gene_type:complete